MDVRSVGILVTFLLALSWKKTLLVSGQKHFRGGSTSIHVTSTSDPNIYKAMLTVVSGWELGKGPCGPGCGPDDIGNSTAWSRALTLNRTGNPEYFGKWTMEIQDKQRNVTKVDITDLVNKNLQGRITNANVPSKWVQEISEFEVDIEANSIYTDIILEGDSWMDLQLQTCTLKTGRCFFHLQQKLSPGTRNDTLSPNNSPMILYKPVYRVKLNEETQIPITVSDLDGDIPKCRLARWVELSGIEALRETNISTDCIVTISAFESAGFHDKDWGIVNFIVEDVPVDNVVMGGNKFKALKESFGQAQVQFLIQTLTNLTSPEFVEPTLCVSTGENRVASFYVYSGATIRIPLYAKPSNESFVDIEIDKFHITTLPQQFLTVAPPQDVPGRKGDKVRMSELVWKIDVQKHAHYLLQAAAIDTSGFDSIDCSFDIEVKVVNYTKTSNPPSTGPYFPYFPDPDAIKCFQGSICTFPIYAKTDDLMATISDISIVNSSSDLTNLSSTWIGAVTFQGDAVFQSDLSLSSSDLGQKELCLRALDNKGLSKERCVQLSLFGLNPCAKNLDVCGIHGVCNQNLTHPLEFYCDCLLSFEGQFCEKKMDPCGDGYCGVNSVYCGYDPQLRPQPLCVCLPGYTGDQCENSLLCIPDPCDSHGTCIPLQATSSHKCQCFPGFSGPDCSVDLFQCENGGVIFMNGTTKECHCRLGFSGRNCSIVAFMHLSSPVTPDPQLLQPNFTHQLSPPTGGTISCTTDVICTFPVYITGKPDGSTPNVTEGPKSPDVNMIVNPTIPDNSTSLPGYTYLTPVSVTSTVPGQKQVCVDIGDGNNVSVSGCYNIVFQDKVTTISPPNSGSQTPVVGPHFLNPTPTDGTQIPCPDPQNGCHLLVYSTPDNGTGNCSTLSPTSGHAIVFSPLHLSDGNCVHEITALPNATSPGVCLQAGNGENRCFDVIPVPKSGTQLCQNVDCGLYGTCLADPLVPSTQCLCHTGYLPPDCKKDLFHCLNGGMVYLNGSATACHCPLGFSDSNCSTADTNPNLIQPALTHQLSPPNGGTITCSVGAPCTYPVYTTGKPDGSIPSVTEGPRSKDVFVSVTPTIPDNSTSLPGHTYLTPVVVVSLTPGNKQVCLDIGSGSVVSSTPCYNIIFKNPAPVTVVPSASQSSLGNSHFVAPTPPDGSQIPCSDSQNGCHLLVYSNPHPVTGKCPTVMPVSGHAFVFKPHQMSDSGCVHQVNIYPDASSPLVCFELSSKEKRCFGVPLVNNSASQLCQNVDCGIYGACLADPLVPSTQCVCRPGHPNCAKDLFKCENGGVMFINGSTKACHCPLGFSGLNCSTADPDPQLNQPTLTDQLSPPNGGTISCEVNVPCTFPVYTSGKPDGSTPNVTEGPKSPDVNMVVNPTIPDNSTSLPGYTYLTPVTVISPVSGNKKVCVDIGDGNNVSASGCYNVIFKPQATSTTQASMVSGITLSPSQTPVFDPHFLDPTPPDGSQIPCPDPQNGCHLLVYSTPHPTTGKCSSISSTSGQVIVFNPLHMSVDSCVHQVKIFPNATSPDVCLQAGPGENRCFEVLPVPQSGTQLCQNVDCGIHGACLADPLIPSTQCICHTGYLPPDCKQEIFKCENGGVVFMNGSTKACHCPLGFSGQNCSTVDPDPQINKPILTNQLSPPNGGTISCTMNVPCTFPVYTTGTPDGSTPNVTEGPKSPDVNMIVNPTIPDNSTSLPGYTYLTPVTVISPVSGNKKVCVDIGDGNNVSTSGCYNVIFKPEVTSTTQAALVSGITLSPSQTPVFGPHFLDPTPPDGSQIPCPDPQNGCHLLVYSTPHPTTRKCSSISSTSGQVIVFNPLHMSYDSCVHQVKIFPNATNPDVCLQAGSGENRCFDILPVAQSGTQLCQNVDCGIHGACLADPLIPSTQCVCHTGYLPPDCKQEIFKCENGGVFFTNGSTKACHCPLGFSGQNCSTVDPDPQINKPTLTNQLSPPNGGTISCTTNVPCTFPVYTTGTPDGTTPNVTEGPKSTDVNMIVNPTIPDNSTSLPGYTYLTPVTVISPVSGNKKVCVDIGDGNNVSTSGCYNVIFKPQVTSTTQAATISGITLSSLQTPVFNPHFLDPTPPDGSQIPCPDLQIGCHLLVYSTPHPTTGKCSSISSTSGQVIVFNPLHMSVDSCVHQVKIFPNATNPDVCLQARSGENRCFEVLPVAQSGTQLCQNVDCGIHGACLADPLIPSTQCVCHTGYLPPDCKQEIFKCENGGVVFMNSSSKACHCPLGFSGQNCSTADPDPQINLPTLTNQLSPPTGGTISCLVNVPCNFPVYTTGKPDGTTPNVTEGPKSPDVNMIVTPTIPDNSTSLPGYTYLTPVIVISPVTGNKHVCVDIGDGNNVSTSGCYNVIFKSPAASTTQSQLAGGITLSSSQIPAFAPHFLDPTPPDGSQIPCPDPQNGCHLLVYSTTNPTTGKCSTVSPTSGHATVFKPNQMPGGNCVNEVIIFPNATDPEVCLQAGSGEDRCFQVLPVTKSGTQLCQTVACGNHGACLADLLVSSAKCVCHTGYPLPDCKQDPFKCENGGIVYINGSTKACYCPIGFLGLNCSSVDPDPQINKPMITHQLAPPNGGTISCKVNVLCTFPVYTTGKPDGSTPNVTEGPKSTDVNMTVDPTTPSNSTSIPGNNFLTPVTVISPDPGTKQVCVDISDGNSLSMTACYNTVFIDTASSTTVSNSGSGSTLSPAALGPHFVAPTPPDGTQIPCPNSQDGCSLLVYSTPLPTTGKCPTINPTSGVAIVFNPQKMPDGSCVHEITVLPNATSPDVCLQAGSGEKRCFGVTPVSQSGTQLCQNVDCGIHGACLGNPLIPSTQCVCVTGYLPPDCKQQGQLQCEHFGIALLKGSTETCHCPLGFSGLNCSTADPDPNLNKPTVIDQLSTPNGGTITCIVNVPCSFPVYSKGKPDGSTPIVTEGCISRDVNVVLDPTISDNSTSLPGYTYLTPVTIISNNPGHKHVCVEFGDGNNVSTTACYNTVFKKPEATTVLPAAGGQTQTSPLHPHFLDPTPPDETKIPCPGFQMGCHLLVYSTPDLVTGKCSSINTTSGVSIVFNPRHMPDGSCVHEVEVLPDAANPEVCLQAGAGENRCFEVILVNKSGSQLCQNVDCGINGSCLADPLVPSTRCVCHLDTMNVSISTEIDSATSDISPTMTVTVTGSSIESSFATEYISQTGFTNLLTSDTMSISIIESDIISSYTGSISSNPATVGGTIDSTDGVSLAITSTASVSYVFSSTVSEVHSISPSMNPTTIVSLSLDSATTVLLGFTSVAPTLTSINSDTAAGWSASSVILTSSVVSTTVSVTGSVPSHTFQCYDKKLWERAFKEHKVTCTCTDPSTGKRKTVIRPRISNERLLTAFGIGCGVSSSTMLIGGIIYLVAKKLKQRANGGRQAHDYLFDKDAKNNEAGQKKQPTWKVLSCFHCGDLIVEN